MAEGEEGVGEGEGVIGADGNGEGPYLIKRNACSTQARPDVMEGIQRLLPDSVLILGIYGPAESRRSKNEHKNSCMYL